jgi:hypothetical protein
MQDLDDLESEEVVNLLGRGNLLEEHILLLQVPEHLEFQVLQELLEIIMLHVELVEPIPP